MWFGFASSKSWSQSVHLFGCVQSAALALLETCGAGVPVTSQLAHVLQWLVSSFSQPLVALKLWLALGMFTMSQLSHFVQSAVVGACAVSASSKSYGQLVHVFDTVQSAAFALFDVWVEFAASIS